LIRFHGSGDGRGVLWERMPPAKRPSAGPRRHRPVRRAAPRRARRAKSLKR
jgi:hypothetical protein